MSAPSGLATLTAQVQAELAARGVAAPHALGRRHADKHAASTRFVWVPKGGTGGPAIRTSAHPRSLATRNLTVEIWIFAEDYAACEALLASLHTCLRALAMGSFELKGESAPAADAHHLTRGEVLIATYLFQLPLEEAPPVTATIADVGVSSDHL